MSKIRVLLSSGQEHVDFDDGIEEIDDVLDRIVSGPKRPHWLLLGDSLVFTGAVSAFQVEGV